VKRRLIPSPHFISKLKPFRRLAAAFGDRASRYFAVRTMLSSGPRLTLAIP
jgi:hypothetical protein